MTSRDVEPRARRASDVDREHALLVLREAVVAGRLTHETFVARIDRALNARLTAELVELVEDLRAARRPSAIERWAAAAARLWTVPAPPRHPRLALPPVAAGDFTIGRDPDCDRVLPDPTVSWRHAALRHPGRWMLTDLGSTNGTFVNGWRVRAVGLPVRAGDVVNFGGRTTFELA
jgi:hypothetical protein